jgi:hypothetical protein
VLLRARIGAALGQLARVFQRMAREVAIREQRLKRQVEELRIEIDETRRCARSPRSPRASTSSIRTVVIRPPWVYGRGGGGVAGLLAQARRDGIGRFVGAGDTAWSTPTSTT